MSVEKAGAAWCGGFESAVCVVNTAASILIYHPRQARHMYLEQVCIPQGREGADRSRSLTARRQRQPLCNPFPLTHCGYEPKGNPQVNPHRHQRSATQAKEAATCTTVHHQ
jgi:hypothetical protein